MLVIVTGPPCSGKSTYIRQNAKPGDIIIDFDDIATALGATSRDYTAVQRAITQYTRAAAIKIAITWHRRGASVWVAECEPSPQRWQQYAQAGARHVRLDVDPAELHRRIDQERPSSYHSVADHILRRQGATVTGGHNGRGNAQSSGREW